MKSIINDCSSKILLVAVALTLCCCRGKTEKTETEKTFAASDVTMVTLTDAQIKTAGIEAGYATNRPVATTLKVTGVVDVPPQNMVSISFPMGGYLKSTKLLPGMHISRGEVIAIIEDQQIIQLQQDYLTAKIKLIFDQKEFERQRDLNASKASSDKLFQQAQAEFSSQKILVSSLSEKLQLIGFDPDKMNNNTISRSAYVRSPIDGYVTKVNVNIGKYINPADVLFEIVDPRDIHLALEVFEKDIEMLHPGQTVIAYTNSNPLKKYRCHIVLIGKDLSDQRKTEIHCHFELYDKKLLPGTYMNAEIEITSASALTLPEDAVVNYESKSYAFIVKGKNSYMITEIKPGATNNGYIEVSATDPDLAKKTFVTKGAYSLLMKMKNTGDDE